MSSCPVENHQPGSKERKTVILFSPFSTYLLVYVFMKSKPVREQLFIKEKKKKRLHSIYMELLFLLILKSFHLVQHFHFLCFPNAILLKGWRNIFCMFLGSGGCSYNLYHQSSCIMSPVKYYFMEPMANLFLNGL